MLLAGWPVHESGWGPWRPAGKIDVLVIDELQYCPDHDGVTCRGKLRGNDRTAEVPVRPASPVNTYAILAAVFSFVVFPPLGIYFGRKAKEQIAQSGERGIELANVGIIAGWIISVLYGLFMIVWCGVVGTMVLGGFNGAN